MGGGEGCAGLLGVRAGTGEALVNVGAAYASKTASVPAFIV